MLTEQEPSEVTGDTHGFEVIKGIQYEKDGIIIPDNYACLRDYDQTCLFQECYRRGIWRSPKWFNKWIDGCSDFVQQNKLELPDDLL